MESKPTEQDIKKTEQQSSCSVTFLKKLNIRNKAIIRTDSVKRKGSDYHALAPQTGLEPVTATIRNMVVSLAWNAS